MIKKLTCVTKLDMSKLTNVLVKLCAVLLFSKDINYNSLLDTVNVIILCYFCGETVSF